MINEIIPGLYQIKIPFPRNPLRDCNIYLARGREGNLMVDTGIDVPESRAELIDDLKKLGIDLKKTAFFLTHMHVDHTANIGFLADAVSTVYFSRPDAALLDYNTPENRLKRAALSMKNGFPPGDMMQGGPLERRSHPMRDFAVARDYNFNYVSEDLGIAVGDFNFKCIMTPGHTRGHVCLYESEKRLFLSGDHILQDITPNISAFFPEDNPLAAYLSSLDKIYNLNVNLVLPAHRRTMNGLKTRIDELKNHHAVRAGEAIAILQKNGRQNGYQVASQMSWDVKERSWDDLPIWQRMFAVGEAIAHLRYLVVEKKVLQENGEKQILYSAP